MRIHWAITAWSTVFAAAALAEVPYTPADDSVVLERITVPRLPGTASLRELRRAWTAQPAHLPAALAYARGALELHRREEDPRYLGYAEAAVKRWSERPRPPPEVLLLRATMRLARLDFALAEQDLQSLIESPAPEGHTALATRASLRLQQGNPQGALADCSAASSHMSPIATAVCVGAARGASGAAGPGLAGIEQALQVGGAPVSTEIWARGVAAELALRLRRPALARQHFDLAVRRMRDAETTDPALLASYADFLLDQGEPGLVRVLLAPYPGHDTLVLRMALAEQALGRAGDAAARDAAQRHVARLARRFLDMRLRQDRSHMREQALFELELRNEAGAALEWIRQSWVHMREPLDARIFLAAALQSGQASAALPVLEWIESTGLQDARLQEKLAALHRALPPR